MPTNESLLCEGNIAAQKMLADVFETKDRGWRGIGVIPMSGWTLNEKYRDFDAEYKYDVTGIETDESTFAQRRSPARHIKPHECPAIGKECTPRKPLRSKNGFIEGACAAYYNYGRFAATAK